MGISPRIIPVLFFNLPFQVLPISVPKQWFGKWQKILEKIIAKDKYNRTSAMTRYRSRNMGDLGIRNLKLYYDAFQLKQLLHIIRNSEDTVWVAMEVERMVPSIRAWPFLSPSWPQLKQIPSLFLQATFLVWKYWGKTLAPILSPLTPFLDLPEFRDKDKYAQYKGWEEKGLYRIQDLIEKGQPISEVSLRRKLAQTSYNWMQIAQVRSLPHKLGKRADTKRTQHLRKCVQAQLQRQKL
ncbi:uncharacterized protein LOC133385983 [Rhineura floridana]|uniref:uncharacterized protein LOC133385983 n=1 Tax=Rhineura floridana TaxID=261503 RepID=UPI002AC891F9|nr:uncharacterized protein LOC133385983 [Rhineura floridana]